MGHDGTLTGILATSKPKTSFVQEVGPGLPVKNLNRKMAGFVTKTNQQQKEMLASEQQAKQNVSLGLMARVAKNSNGNIGVPGNGLNGTGSPETGSDMMIKFVQKNSNTFTPDFVNILNNSEPGKKQELLGIVSSILNSPDVRDKDGNFDINKIRTFAQELTAVERQQNIDKEFLNMP